MPTHLLTNMSVVTGFQRDYNWPHFYTASGALIGTLSNLWALGYQGGGDGSSDGGIAVDVDNDRIYLSATIRTPFPGAGQKGVLICDGFGTIINFINLGLRNVSTPRVISPGTVWVPVYADFLGHPITAHGGGGGAWLGVPGSGDPQTFTGNTTLEVTPGYVKIIILTWTTGVTLTVSDNLGNTYLPLGPLQTATAGGTTVRQQMYYAMNPATSTVHTYIFSGGNTNIMWEVEIYAIGNVGGLQVGSAVGNASVGGGPGTTLALASVTPLTRGSLIISALAGMGPAVKQVISPPGMFVGGAPVAHVPPYIDWTSTTYAANGRLQPMPVTWKWDAFGSPPSGGTLAPAVAGSAIFTPLSVPDGGHVYEYDLNGTFIRDVAPMEDSPSWMQVIGTTMYYISQMDMAICRHDLATNTNLGVFIPAPASVSGEWMGLSATTSGRLFALRDQMTLVEIDTTTGADIAAYPLGAMFTKFGGATGEGGIWMYDSYNRLLLVGFDGTPVTSFLRSSDEDSTYDLATGVATYDPCGVRLIPDEHPPGLVWIEFEDYDAHVHVWSEIDIADPETYYFGFKQSLLIEAGAIQRALSDDNGAHESMGFAFTLEDTRRTIRGLFEG